MFICKANICYKQKTELNIIELDSNNLTVIHVMLQYLYKFDYTDDINFSQMIFTAQVYVLADKYDIQTLKTLAMTKFEKLAKTD